MRSSIFYVVLSAGLLAASSAWADPAPPGAPVAPQPASAETPAPVPLVAASEDERSAKNAVYFEGLGPGLVYSINYDRSFGDFAGRVGFGYLPLSASTTSPDPSGNGVVQETASVSFIAVPITVSYLGIGNKKSMLELGAGATIWHLGAGAQILDAGSSTTANEALTLVLPVAIVGYRYQPPGGGFVFKVGMSPLFGGSSIPVYPLPYLALGGAF